MEAITLDLESDLESGPGDGVWVAIGKVLAEKPLNKGAVKTILRNLWPEKDVPAIGDVENNTFSVTFVSQEKLFKALLENPWAVMGYCFNLKFWPPELAVGEIDMNLISYWTQIHNLPRDLLTENNARRIGSILGDVIEIEEIKGRFGLNRSFLRIRVGLKLENPLIPGFWIPRGGDRKIWATVKYEKLADFCFNCGRLGHSNKFCKSEEKSPMSYGPHMRVAPAKQLWSPGKQRSQSWGGTVEEEWRESMKPGVARALPFSQARGKNVLGQQELVTQQSREQAKEDSSGVIVGGSKTNFQPSRHYPSSSTGFSNTLDVPITSNSVNSHLMGNRFGPRIGSPNNFSERSELRGFSNNNRGQAIEPENEEVGVPELPGPRIYIQDGIEVYSPGSGELVPVIHSPEIVERELASANDLKEISTPSKFSPSKVIKTVMNLSNVFRSMNLKRGLKDVDISGNAPKRGRLEANKGVVITEIVDNPEPEWPTQPLCLDFGGLLPVKGRRKVMGRKERKYKKSVKKERSVPALTDVPITEIGIKLSKDCPMITHLLFVDDSLFFLEAKQDSCSKMAEIGIPGQNTMPDEEGPQMVSDLINKEDRSWKEDKIQNCLDSKCHVAIQCVQLSSSEGSGKLIWPDEKSGNYSVKTGYHVLKNSFPLRTTMSASSSHTIDRSFWKFIWSISAPPRIKHFLWRAGTNSLATKLALFRKRIGTDPLCPICHASEESIEHTLFLCSWVDRIWFGSLGLTIDKGQVTSFDD
ncbi:hypothetical protein COLO4_36252 [Corchorus olitorius]|uniref:CCHC-type domain-containing protein n=1 Tax=Corchorus olitorius TaxID=93759 RepID=A0A1R3GAA5_9ROSI|nr:hypothetical protein COLO4_36252 [Corchorus olitorius]